MKYRFILIFGILYISCNPVKPSFRFSNFKGTIAEPISKAIERNDTIGILKELEVERVNINFKDEKYEVSLLTLAMMNNKRNAFEKLLELGADPNVKNSYCVSPLKAAIRYNKNCDTYFIKKLLEYGAEVSPLLFKECNSHFVHDPIIETILYYYENNRIECQSEILKLLTSKLNNSKLLFINNNSLNFRQNIVYTCLSTHKNISALKYLIVDLGYKVPEKIFIDGTVLLDYEGYKDLKGILSSREFDLEKSEYKRKAKNEILNYLNKKQSHAPDSL